MARNRQRAKQRQAERRARRLADEGAPPEQERDDQATDDPTTVDPSPAVPPELAAGAPPQDEGFSERIGPA